MVPKKIEGFKKPDWYPLLVDGAKHNDRVLLVGHAGVGKTAAILQHAAEVQVPVRRCNLNGQTMISDFVGQWTAKGGELQWIDGILPQAMRSGQWLILDEVDYAQPEVLAVLHAVLEPSGALVLAENGGEIVEPHANFRIFGTANGIGATSNRGLYQGSKLMNEAFLDRWTTVISVYYPEPAFEMDILMGRVEGMTLEIAALIVRFAGEWRKAFGDGQLSSTFSPRKAIQFGEKIMRYGVFRRAFEVSVLNKLDPEDQRVASEIFQRFFGGA